MADSNEGSGFDGIQDSADTTELPGQELFEGLEAELVGESGDGQDSPDELLANAISNPKDKEEDEEASEEDSIENSEDPEDTGDEEDEVEEEDSEEENEEEEAKPVGRAQKRIKQLASRNKELQEQIAQADQVAQDRYTQAYQQQMQNQANQHQQQMQQMQQLYEVSQAQLQALHTNKESDEDANLSDVDRWAKKTAQRGAEMAREAMSPELKAVTEQVTALQNQIAARDKQVEERQVMNSLYTQTEAARNTHFFKDIDPQTVSPELAKVVDDMTMSLVAARNISPEEAGKFLGTLVDRMTEQRMATRGKPSKGKKKVKPASTALPSTQRSAAKGGGKRPSMAAIRHAGYDNFIQWAADGRPKVSEPT